MHLDERQQTSFRKTMHKRQSSLRGNHFSTSQNLSFRATFERVRERGPFLASYHTAASRSLQRILRQQNNPTRDDLPAQGLSFDDGSG